MSLKNLYIRNSGVLDISGLRGLSSLEYLDLSGNNLTNLTFNEFINLEYLNISSCKIKSLESFTVSMSNGVLDISGNEISDLAPLSSLSKINILNIQSNNIADYAAVENINASKIISDNSNNP